MRGYFIKNIENIILSKIAPLNQNYSSLWPTSIVVPPLVVTFVVGGIAITTLTHTFENNNVDYAIRSYLDAGIIYCDTSVDTTYGEKISVTTDDHNINFVMLKRNSLFLSSMRYYFDHGCFRFKDLRCKEAILKALSYWFDIRWLWMQCRYPGDTGGINCRGGNGFVPRFAYMLV